MKSITKRIISTLVICGALVLEAGATAFSSIGKGIVHKVDAAEQSFYTLTFNTHKDSSKSGYASSGTFTDNDVGWKVDGANFSLADGFGFGGKSTGTLNRSFNTTTLMSEKVTKIEVVTGNMSAASATLSVKGYTNSDLSSGEVDYGSKSLAASSTFTFTSTSGLSNGYFKFSLGVQPNNSGSNKYVLLKTVTFYKDSGSTSTYTVTYDGNGNTGGSVPTDSTAYSSGASVTVKGNTGNLEKSGFTFNGWNTQSDGKGTSYSAGSTFNIAANTTLYANWKGSTPLGNSVIIDATTLNLGSDKIIEDTVVGIYHFGGGGSGNGTKLQALAAGVSNNLSDNGTILIGKSGAYIYNSSPLISDISSIDVYCNGGSASTNVVVAVKCGSSQLSSAIGSSETVSFNSQLSSTDTVFSNANTIPDGSKYFRLQVMSAHNAQIQIKLNLKSVQPVTVTNTFTNISSSGASTATPGTDYTATLSATNGKVLPNTITVKNGTSTLEMGSDKDYTYNPSNGSLIIFGSKITDNIEIIAAGEDAKTLTGISVSNYKTKLYVGHEFEFGGTVTAHYDGEDDEDVTALTTFSGYNMNAAGSYVVTATFQGKTATYNLTVESVVLDSISIATPASKLSFLLNDTFNYNGLVIAGLNNDGSEATIVQENVVVTPPDMTTVGNKTVQITYEGKNTSYTINVKDPATLTKYRRISSESDITEGVYLIVYEASATSAMSFGGVDVAKSAISTDISTDTFGKFIFENDSLITVALEEYESGYAIKVNNGDNANKYIYATSSNGLKFGDDPAEMTVDYSSDHASIVGTASTDASKSMYFKFNNATNEQRFRFFTSDGQQRIDLYKLEQKFDVTFNLQGHGSAIDKQTVTAGGLVTKPTDPTATGYTFGGWYKESGCENAWDFATDKVTEATELFAKWTLNSHTLTWVTDGNPLTGVYTSGSVAYGTTIVAPDTPTKTGNVFAGWNPSVPETMPDNDVTLTATWTANVHNVTFHRGQDDVVGPTQYEYGSSVSHPNPLPTQLGATFVGWTLTEGSEVIAFPVSNDTFKMIDSDVNFYPVFSSDPVVTGIELSSTFDSIYITNSNDVFSAEVTVSDETSELSTDVVWTVSPADAGTFSNGSTSMTTESNVSPEFTASKAYEGDNKVTITATSAEDDSFAESFEFNVNTPTDLELVSIVISGTASKTEYYNTDTDDDVDPTGLTVTATYESSEQAASYTTTEDVTDDVAWSLVKTDPAHLVATFEGETDTYDGITIVEDYISSIYVVDGTGKRDFILGDEFTTVDDEGNDIVVMGVHADGKTPDSVIDADDYTIDSSKYEQYTVPGDEGAAYEIGVSLNGTALSTSYDVTVKKFVPQYKTQFELVTDASSLEEGDEIVFFATKDSVGYVPGTYNSDKTCLNTVSGASVADNVLTLPEGTITYTLSGSSGNWTLTSSEGVLGATAVKKLAIGSGTQSWSIAIDEDNLATISPNSEGYGRLLYNYNNGTPRFLNYTSATSTSMILPTLYKKVQTQVTYSDLIKFEPTYEGGAKHVGDTLTIEDFDFEDKVLFNDGESHLEDKDISLIIKSGATLESTSNTVVVAIKRGEAELATKSFTISAAVQYGATLDVNIDGSVDADLSALVDEGGTFVGSVLPTAHYNLDDIDVVDSQGESVVFTYNGETGVLTVENVTDNLTVVVTTSPKAVDTSLLENGVAATHYQLTGETGAVYGGTYEATLSAINQDTVKYDISSVVVTNNGVIVTGAYDEATGKIKVEGVNGAIVVSVTCTDHKYTASLDAESEHVALVNTSEIAYGATYTTTFTVDEHYQIDSVSVTDSEGNPVTSTFSGGTLTVENVTDDLTISVETSVITHTLSFDYDDTKIELSSEPEIITELETIQITISPKPGYKVDSVTVNGETATLHDGVLTLTGITANSTIVINDAEADPLAYTISHDENSHFTTGSEQYTGQIGYGGSLVETIVADEGYRVDDTCISVSNEDGDVAFSFVDGVLTVTGVTKDITVTVEPIQTFNISLPEGDHFDTDADKDVIDYNSSVQVEILVDDYYHVTSLGYTIGGGSFVDLTESVVLEDGYYTFAITNVTGDVNVTLVVAIDTYTVEATGDDNVEVTFNATSPVAHGTDVTFTVTPDEGYNIATVEYKMGDGDWESVALNVNNQFTLYVTADVQVRATSAIQTFDIDVPTDDNFVINAIPNPVDYNGSTNVALSVDEHYHVTLLGYTIGDGSFVDITDEVVLVNNCYQFQISGITGDVKVTLTVAIDTYTVTPTPDTNSYINVDTSVAHGDDLVVEVGASAHYHLVTITYTVEGEAESHSVDPADLVEGEFTIEGVTGNVTITVTSAKDTVSVTTTLNDSTAQYDITSVEYGGTYTNTFTATAGCSVESVTYQIGDAEPVTVTGNTVTINNVTDALKVTVNTHEVTVTGITVVPTEVTVEFGEDVNLNSLVVTATYSDDTSKTVTGFTVTGYNKDVAGEYDATIEYTEGDITVTCPLKVTVEAEVVLESISVDPTEVTIAYGGSIDVNNLTVTAHYSDGGEATVTDFVLGNYNAKQVGEQDVTITYQGETCTLKLVVEDKVIDHIEVVEGSYTTSVYQGDEYTFDGKVNVYYVNDEEPVEISEGFTVSEIDTSILGEKTLTVSYGGKSVEVKVNVVAKPVQPTVTELVVTDYTNKIEVGGTYTFDGIVVAKYSDGTEETLKASDYTVSALDTSTEGEKTVTITFGDKTKDITVTVYKPEQPTPQDPPMSTGAKVGIGVGAAAGSIGLAVGLFFLIKLFKLKK